MVINMWLMDDSGGDEKGSCCWSKPIAIGPIEGAWYPATFRERQVILLVVVGIWVNMLYFLFLQNSYVWFMDDC